MVEMVIGVLVAVVIIILSRLLSKYFTTKFFAATVLVAIAFIYVGFSLKDNSSNLMILEISVSLIFYFIALIGYTYNNLWIAYGIILHGLWDILHHNGLIVKTDIPWFWPSFCSIVDVIDGFYFLFVFKRLNNLSSNVIKT